MDLAAHFGAVLKRLRKQAGLSQEQLGFEAGLERNYISMLELGQRQPTITTVEKLAISLKIKASGLIAEVETEASKANS